MLPALVRKGSWIPAIKEYPWRIKKAFKYNEG
jgi:hypothetical protein